MIRFDNRQLHIILIGLIIVSALIGLFFSLGRDKSMNITGKLSGLENISDGVVAGYETLNEAKWRQFGDPENKEAKWYISEVLNLPNSFETKAGNIVNLYRKLPDFSEEKAYLVFTSYGQHVKISINNTLIYELPDSELQYSYHIVPIDYHYKNGDMKIVVSNDNKDVVEISALKFGTYTNLLADAFSENGGMLVVGVFLVLMSIGVFLLCVFLKTEYNNKQMLIYTAIEGALAGLLFITNCRIFRITFNWELLNLYMRSCMMLIAGVGHLLVVRCLIRRKKMLTAVDFGVVFYCVMFISMLILRWFGLLSFKAVYIACLASYAVGIVVYTFFIGNASYDYKQNESRPIFIANIIIVCAGVIELVLYIVKSPAATAALPLIAGSLLYFVLLWGYGLKRASYVEDRAADGDDNINELKKQVIDELNPNLLFASFKSLQKMVKAGSVNSPKMIYYISVYLMNNIKAMTEKDSIIAFDDELEHIVAYLQLQKMRNHNLSFSVEAKIRDFNIPRNALEPMVENAVKYGIGGKENKGNVVVRTYEREDGYAIQIIDDGAGFDTKKLKDKSPTSLKHLFGVLEELCLARTEVISKEGKGTVITIVLPILENELI